MHISFWPLLCLGMKLQKIKNDCIIPSLQKPSSSFFTLSNMAKTRMGTSVLSIGILSHQMPFHSVQGMSHFCPCSLMGCVPLTVCLGHEVEMDLKYKQQSRLRFPEMAERVPSEWGCGQSQSTYRISGYTLYLNVKCGCPK